MSAAVEHITQASYILAAGLFIFSLRWLSRPQTARRGVFAGVVGMALALALTRPWGGGLSRPALLALGWVGAGALAPFGIFLAVMGTLAWAGVIELGLAAKALRVELAVAVNLVAHHPGAHGPANEPLAVPRAPATLGELQFITHFRLPLEVDQN